MLNPTDFFSSYSTDTGVGTILCHLHSVTGGKLKGENVYLPMDNWHYGNQAIAESS